MQKDPETFAIIGAAMEVHRELGRGFLELVYQTALALEFQDRGIPFKAEVALPIRGSDCFGFDDHGFEANKVRAVSAAEKLVPVSGCLQFIDELRLIGARQQRGLLLNFGAASLEHKRLVFSPSDNLRKSAKSVDEIYL
jgi:GxxExxY protein